MKSPDGELAIGFGFTWIAAPTNRGHGSEELGIDEPHRFALRRAAHDLGEFGKPGVADAIELCLQGDVNQMVVETSR